MSGIKFKGLDKLQKKLKKNVEMKAVKDVVKFHGGQLSERMKAQTKKSFVKINPKTGKPYSEGATASSINTIITDGGLEARVGPTTNYAEYVEYGTRRMEAEPFVKPALDVQKEKFKASMKKIVR